MSFFFFLSNNDLKGTTNKFSGQRSNSSRDNRSFAKTPCLVSVVETSWFAEFKHPSNTPVLFPGKSHGRRSLVGYRPWGCEESDTTERLHFHFSHSCIGEGTGNPLQCSCLENPRDGGAWWAAVYGVAQNRTRLKRLSSSSKHYTTRST